MPDLRAIFPFLGEEVGDDSYKMELDEVCSATKKLGVPELSESFETLESTLAGSVPDLKITNGSVVVEVDDLGPDADKVAESIPVEKEVKDTSKLSRMILPTRPAGVKAVEPAAKADETVHSHLEKGKAFLQLTPQAKRQSDPPRSFYEWRERGRKAWVPAYFSLVEIEAKYTEIITEAKEKDLLHTIDWDNTDIPQVTLMKKWIHYLIDAYEKGLPKIRDFQDEVNQTLSKSRIQERGFDKAAKAYNDIIKCILGSGCVWEHNLNMWTPAQTAAETSEKNKANEAAALMAENMKMKMKMPETEETTASPKCVRIKRSELEGTLKPRKGNPTDPYLSLSIATLKRLIRRSLTTSEE